VIGAVALTVVCARPSLATAATDPPQPLDQIVLSSPGAGYTVTSQGPVDASSFAASSAGQGAAGRALSDLGHQISSYRRSWQDAAGTNQVQDLLVQFSTAASATAFVGAVRHSLDSASIISEGVLPSVPHAQRTTYYSTTGVGQAVTMQAGEYADVLSFFSETTGNQGPINAATVGRVAEAQRVSMLSAPGGHSAARAHASSGSSASGVIWAVVAVVVLAGAVATPLVLRRYQPRRAADASQGARVKPG
jgi:hypothetical protein